MILHHNSLAESMRLADSHGHAERLQAVETWLHRGVWSHAAVRCWRCAVCNRVQGCRNVSAFRVWRRFLEGAEVVFAGVLLFVLSRQAEAALNAIAAIVCPLVSVRRRNNVSCLLCAWLAIPSHAAAVVLCCAVCAVWWWWFSVLVLLDFAR